jgi:type II pantothenate kinase
LVNIGSGVSILKFDNEDEFIRISGTSLGGGMFLGLSHLFTGINDFDELLKMTK